MKNIIWEQPDATLCVYQLSADADSQAVAQDLLSQSLVDASWTPVAFDVDQLPMESQATWRCIDGRVVAVESLVAAESIRTQIAALNAEVAALEVGYPNGVRVALIALAEKEAAALGAARVPPLTREQSIAVAYAGNTGYRALVDRHQLVISKEAQIVALEAQL